MKYTKDLFVRILIAVSLLVIPVNIFYFLFSNITLWGSLPFLYLLGYSIKANSHTLLVNNQSLGFVPACVATSAYYLLALLVLLTKDVRLKTRVYLLFSGAFLVFLMNVVRIDILLYVLTEFGENWFDKVHILFWHFVSSVYVAAVWIFLAYRFKIRSIPVYSDFRFLLSQSVFGNGRTVKKGKKPFSKKKLRKTRVR